MLRTGGPGILSTRNTGRLILLAPCGSRARAPLPDPAGTVDRRLTDFFFPPKKHCMSRTNSTFGIIGDPIVARIYPQNRSSIYYNVHKSGPAMSKRKVSGAVYTSRKAYSGDSHTGYGGTRTGGYMWNVKKGGKEMKFHDCIVDARTIATATNAMAGLELDPDEIAVEGCLNTISAQKLGTSEIQRVGRVIYIHKVFVRGVVHSLTSATARHNGEKICLWLVLDRQTNRAQMASEDLFYTAAGVGQPDVFINQMYDPQYSSRFRVVKRIDMIINPATAGSVPSTDVPWTLGIMKSFKMSVKFKKPIKVNYFAGGTTADVASIIDNSFHVLGATTSSAGDGVINYVARVRYTD